MLNKTCFISTEHDLLADSPVSVQCPKVRSQIEPPPQVCQFNFITKSQQITTAISLRCFILENALYKVKTLQYYGKQSDYNPFYKSWH